MSCSCRFVVAALAAASLAALAGCEDNVNGNTCGLGTHAEGSVCVADPVQNDAGLPQQDTGPLPQEDAGTDAPKVKGEVGAPCALPSDCKSLVCLTAAIDARLTGGYCSQMCSSTACPLGSACIPAGGMQVCFAYCDPGAPVCRDGYACQPSPEAPTWGFCAPKCRAEVPDDCPAGGVCSTDGFCTLPPTCDPLSPSCGTGTTCMATGQSSTGGYCFEDCTAAGDCKDSEVCQALGIGSDAGICVPPPCASNADCPVGATCAVQHDGLMMCQPPTVCTDTCTDTTKSCVGGLCLAKCSAGATGDTECTALQAGLACADSLGGVCMPKCGAGGVCAAGSSCFTTDDVCLPTGSFPGSQCIPAGGSHTEAYCLDVGDVPQTCMAGQCLPTCATNGEADCAAVSDALTCVEALDICLPKCVSGQCPAGLSCLDSEGACLPTGSFPGSPCRADDSCDGLKLTADLTMPQACVGGTCIPTCTAEAHCSGFGLTCEQAMTGGLCVYPGAATGTECPTGYSCSDKGAVADDHENACLPTGAFPQSPCRAAGSPNGRCDRGLSANGQPFDLGCFAEAGNICLPICTNDYLCHQLSATSGCFENLSPTLGGACMNACTTDAQCGYTAGATSGYACYQGAGVCLPLGSFPSSPCGTDAVCLPYGGVLPQTCYGEVTTGTPADGQCVVVCTPGATGDAICGNVDPSLFCMASAEGGAAGGVCVPKGAAPFGPCTVEGTCGSAAGLQMTCDHGMCVFECGGLLGDAFCSQVGQGMNFPAGTLTCENAFTHSCRFACNAGACAQPAHECTSASFGASAEYACLPQGSFPLSSCRAAADPRGKCDAQMGLNPIYNLMCDDAATTPRCQLPCDTATMDTCVDFAGTVCFPLGGGTVGICVAP